MSDSDAYICLHNAAVAAGVDMNMIPSDRKPDLLRQAEECLDVRRFNSTKERIAFETECLKSMLLRQYKN